MNGLALADGQRPELHLQRDTKHGLTILHWTGFMGDYTGALNAYWSDLESDPTIRANAEARDAKHPLMQVIEVKPPGTITFPVTFPLTFTSVGATAYGGIPSE